MRVCLLKDEPISSTREDSLGFVGSLDLLRDLIRANDPPFTCAILGDWGSGKTSLMQMLKTDLDLKLDSEPFVPIWFNAWQYENEVNIVYPLLHAIKRDFEARLGTEQGDLMEKFRRVVRTSALALTDLGLRATTKTLTGEALKLSDIVDNFKYVREQPKELEAALSGWVDVVSELNGAFETLLDSYADAVSKARKRFGKDDVRFVIFIDDLNHCDAATAISFLENLRNYLRVRNAIFVVGLYPKITHKAIGFKYEVYRDYTDAFFDKILDYSFAVPAPSRATIEMFIQFQVDKPSLHLQQRVTDETLWRRLADMMVKVGISNPRKIKRVLNRILLFGCDFEKLSHDEYRYYVQLVIIAECFPRLFHLMAEEPRLIPEIRETVQRIRAGEASAQDFEDRFETPIEVRGPQLLQLSYLFEFDSGDEDYLYRLTRELNQMTPLY